MEKNKYYIQTFGCQMNVYDSDRVATLLEEESYQRVNMPEEADLIFINTCSVREKPVQKLLSALGRFRKIKRRNPRLILGMGGCVAQQEGERLLKRFSFLDFVIGTKELRRIKEILEDLKVSGKRRAAVALEGRTDPYADLPLHAPPSRISSFVTIMQGCDNYCAYCIVPFVRGREVSRASRDILEEIRLLASSGVKEVTLLGQNVNSYGQKPGGEISFTELLEGVQEIPGIARIRFTTSHPKDLSSKLIGAFGRLPKLCEHIHLPLQSGSNRILALMNRGYTCEEYLDKIGLLRETCPQISVTTDMIVGFPGETDKDFAATLNMIAKARFDEFFSFIYGDRPYTQARLFPGKVPEEISQKRLEVLQSLQKEISEKQHRCLEGEIAEVLVEGPSKSNPRESAGRTRSHHTVNFPGRNFPDGSLIKIKITGALAHSLRGEALGKGDPDP
jgi:tRNA-2-methylthio-N6-dimethylallyladenosine synthase